MTRAELDQLRREQWRVNGAPVVTFEDTRGLVDSVGLCLMFPQKPPVLLPTLIGAVAGTDQNLPSPKQAFADPRTQQAAGLMHRLVRERAAFVSNLFPDNPLLLSPAVFPYFYALLAERGGGREENSQLARLAWAAFERRGPLTVEQLREQLGAEISIAAIERALGELWMRMRIMPVDRNGSVQWDSLQRWAPQTIKHAAHVSVAAALSALISQYVLAAVAADPQEIADFFSHLSPRSKVNESVNALLAAREFTLVNVGQRAMVQVAPVRAPQQRPPARPRPPRHSRQEKHRPQ